MNKYLIYKYAMNITKEDIKKYANSINYILSDDEINIIHYYIKNKCKEFIEGNPKPILIELKNNLSTQTYTKIIEIYNKYKSFLN